MKVTGKLCIYILLLTGLAIHPAKATIIDVADSGGYGYFMDTDTGYTWLDLDNFTFNTYNEMAAIATSLGFTIATTAQVHTLLDPLSLTGSEWTGYNAIMGGTSSSRNLIWGAYDNGLTGNIGWSWAFNTDTVWSFNDYTGYPEDIVPNAVYGDMGIWAFRIDPIASVPEPASVFLMALGLLGLGIVRRKRNA